VARDRGALWTALAVTRSIASRVARRAGMKMRAIERTRYLTGAGTVSSQNHSVANNRTIWDGWDWTDQGEQWTRHVTELKGLDPDQWKATITNLIRREIPHGSVVLEVGPGAGRWTEILRDQASRLVLVDISQTCLDLCRNRFGSGPEMEYLLLEGDAVGVLDVVTESVDVVWSYDAFVHINPTDVDGYLAEFSRILRPGGRAVIHHAGEYDAGSRDDFRADMTREWFAALVRRHDLIVVAQDAELPHKPGDVITFIRKPGTQPGS
jgi:SAM-dependent methyltransferase